MALAERKLKEILQLSIGNNNVNTHDDNTPDEESPPDDDSRLAAAPAAGASKGGALNNPVASDGMRLEWFLKHFQKDAQTAMNASEDDASGGRDQNDRDQGTTPRPDVDACSLPEFAVYVTNMVRRVTEGYLRPNEVSSDKQRTTSTTTGTAAGAAATPNHRATPKQQRQQQKHQRTARNSQCQQQQQHQQQHQLNSTSSNNNNNSSHLKNTPKGTSYNSPSYPSGANINSRSSPNQSTDRSFANNLASNCSTPVRYSNNCSGNNPNNTFATSSNNNNNNNSTSASTPRNRKRWSGGNNARNKSNSQTPTPTPTPTSAAALTSTPTPTPTPTPAQMQTQMPRSNDREINRRSGASSNVCLGDFIVSSPARSTKKRTPKQHLKQQQQQRTTSSSIAVAPEIAPATPTTTPCETPTTSSMAKTKRRVVPTTITSGQDDEPTAPGEALPAVPPTITPSETPTTSSSSSLVKTKKRVILTTISGSQDESTAAGARADTSTAIAPTAGAPPIETPTKASSVRVKKRVVPTTITSGLDEPNVPFGSRSSAFSNDNNMLQFTDKEIDDENDCSIMAARKSLRLNASELTEEMKVATVQPAGGYAGDAASPPAADAAEMVADCPNRHCNEEEEEGEEEEEAAAQAPSEEHLFDVMTSAERELVASISQIYTLLIDMNFSANILNELSFLLNLLNATDQCKTGWPGGSHDTRKAAQGAITDQPSPFTTSPSSTSLAPLSSSSATLLDTLQKFPHCVYFALCVLKGQRQQLALLDFKSLSVVLENERIAMYDDELLSYLVAIYDQKQQLEAEKVVFQETSSAKAFENVYFDEDKDSRNNFTTNNEFAAFKSQRDLFYMVFQMWERNYYKPTWKFSEITPKIREIFRNSESPINMAHLARLFVSQLLLSARNMTTPEEIGINIDLQKFNRLSQRLVEPSNFSSDYQFPHKQAFFRDFITHSSSQSFAIQLKMALFSELMTLNESVLQHPTVVQIQPHHHTVGADAAGAAAPSIAAAQQQQQLQHQKKPNATREYFVEAEDLSNMMILAKFLGFVTAQPFSQQNGCLLLGKFEQQQIHLRSLLQSDFNVCALLKEALNEGKLLITLPWLVQYFVMLDNVTLKLSGYAEAIDLMCCIFMKLGKDIDDDADDDDDDDDDDQPDKRKSHPTSKFILRMCLGWLFESKPLIAEQYYTYRIAHVKALTGWGDAKRARPQQKGVVNANAGAAVVLQFKFNPQLESIINVACPFLGDFRVSIMPSKYVMIKYLSRTGRYRHITTSLANQSAGSANRMIMLDHNDGKVLDRQVAGTAAAPAQLGQQGVEKIAQNRLIEAFLHSLSATKRKFLEFLAERIYKCVIRDVQIMLLMPSKAEADREINEIKSTNVQDVAGVVQMIYSRACREALAKWDVITETELTDRIPKALDSLLAHDTDHQIKLTYAHIVYRDATAKVQEWRRLNLVKHNFYCENVNEVADKICKANHKERQGPPQSTELEIVSEYPQMTDFMYGLQFWLHHTSVRSAELQSIEPIRCFLEEFLVSFQHKMPTLFYVLLGSGIIQIVQHVIMYKPHFLNRPFIGVVCDVWMMVGEHHDAMVGKKRRRHNNRTPPSRASSYDEDIVEHMATDADHDNIDYEEVYNALTNGPNKGQVSFPGIYDSLITVPFIQSLEQRQICFDKLQELLVAMVRKHLISLNFINCVFMPIFKDDWDPAVLNLISNMLHVVVFETSSTCGDSAEACGGGGGGGGGRDGDDDGDDAYGDYQAKAQLFMEFFAELSANVDF